MNNENLTRTVAQRLSLLITTCFFLSGVSGLIYEILWTRMIVKIVGGAPFAVAIILTIFMGGLGLGSYIASGRIDRIGNPLRLVKIYGVLELVVAGYALVFPLFLMAFEPLYSILYNNLFEHFMLYNLLTFAGCAILLIIPVTCMGATLPILCRFYVTHLSHLGTNAGRLYGLNTIGAAFGALICGFWLISALGIWGTLAVAVAINALIGLLCIRAAASTELDGGTAEDEKSEPAIAEGSAEPGYRGAVGAALIIFAVSGFCAMAYEVIWTKLLGLLVGSTTYSFTIVLVTFILGLALGSILFGRLADRVKNPTMLLIGTQIAAAIFALGVSQLVGNSQLFFAKLLYYTKDEFALRSAVKAAALFVIMIFPTICLGATFPLVGKIFTRSIARVGRSIGVAYAINTIGAVSGSFAAGFILIPLMGKEISLSSVIGFQLGTTLIITIWLLIRNRETLIRGLLLILPAAAGIVACFYYPMWDRHALSLSRAHSVNEIANAARYYSWPETILHGEQIMSDMNKGQLIYYGDGVGGFTTVLKNYYAMGDTCYSMANSGKVDASTLGDMGTQTLLGNLPMLFHPNARDVMVLGLASGITAGEILNFPVERLDVVEINGQVVDASDFFVPWNNNVLSDPRTHLIIQDGRAHLDLTDREYDVIISEPSNPWLAGLATLFTKEMFQYAHDKLNENGIFVQFFHSYQMDWESFALVGRTFARVFPNSLLISTAPSGEGPDYLFVGFRGKGRLSLETAMRNFQYVRRSKNVDLRDPRLLYRMILSEDLVTLFGTGSITTDARPRLEFSAPKLLYETDHQRTAKNLMTLGRVSARTKAIVDSLTTDMDARIDFAAYALSVNLPFPRMVDLSALSPSQQERYFDIAKRHVKNRSTSYLHLIDKELKHYLRLFQIETLENEIDIVANPALSNRYLGDLYYEEGDIDKAIERYRRSISIKPKDGEVHRKLGVALTKQNRLSEAIASFEEAIRLTPHLNEAYTNLGFALALRGESRLAREQFLKAIAINPSDSRAHYNLGLAMAQSSEADGAIEHFREALKLDPSFVDAHSNLGIALIQKGQLDEAAAHFSAALKLNPNFEPAQRGLERVNFLRSVRGN